MTQKQNTILIIDDNATNLGVMSDYLESSGFVIMAARNGEHGLKMAKMAHPDLILLDVMMPGIDGFETCRRLKADATTQEIPVIFMTALTDVEDKVMGFEVGAVDYVTKPLEQREVLARVTMHLRLQEQAQLLQKQAAELTKLNADKDKFFSIVAHDLKGPFMPLLGFTEILPKMVDDMPLSEIKRISHHIHNSAQNVYRLLENLLNWSRLQQGRMVYTPIEVELAQVVDHNMAILHEVAQVKRVYLKNEVTPEWVVLADMQMLDTILRNLIANALKFTPEEGQVKTWVEETNEQMLMIAVTDTGIGMSEEIRRKLFQLDQKVTQLGTAQEQGTGLGLIICQEMVHKHGGRIWVESEVGQGTTVKFTVPLHHRHVALPTSSIERAEVVAMTILPKPTFIMPSLAELNEIWEMLTLGNLIGMERRAMQLAQSDEIYRPFALQLQHFARQFDEEAIMAMLKPYLDGASLLDLD